MTSPQRQSSAPDNTWFYATKPTRYTVFLRTFLPWQAWRFAWINGKMLAIIRRSHQTHRTET